MIFLFNSKLQTSNSSLGSGVFRVLWLVFWITTQTFAAPPTTPTGTPRRIISMAPNLTEIVYDIGAQDVLVGVTDYCKSPPAAQSKPKIGGWINPNYEKIVSLKPDLVLVLQFNGKPVETLRQLKIPILVLKCVTVQDVLDAYDVLGKTLGRELDAKKAKARLVKRLDKIQQLAKSRKPLSVLFVIGRNPGSLEQIYGVGPRNFVDELIHRAGGVNVLSDSSVPYPLVSKEQLIRSDPDVIFDSLNKSEVKSQDFQKEAKVWNKMPVLKAVKNGHVYCFDNEDFLVPGPTMVKLAEYLSSVFQKVGSQP
jgi:iron complex transport system substrate-binding protein